MLNFLIDVIIIWAIVGLAVRIVAFLNDVEPATSEKAFSFNFGCGVLVFFCYLIKIAFSKVFEWVQAHPNQVQEKKKWSFPSLHITMNFRKTFYVTIVILLASVIIRAAYMASKMPHNPPNFLYFIIICVIAGCMELVQLIIRSKDLKDWGKEDESC